MQVSKEQLRKMLYEAFDFGYNNSSEMKEQVVADLIKKYNLDKQEDFLIYNITDLQRMPLGTIFEHSTRGRCWIVNKDGRRAMQFDSEVLEFNNEGDPWDKPMKLLHSDSPVEKLEYD